MHNRESSLNTTPATSKKTKAYIAAYRPTEMSNDNPDYATKKIAYDTPLSTDKPKLKQTVIRVFSDKDSQNLASDHYHQGKKVSILNAGNAEHCLGNFELDGGTQEESLGFTSDLHARVYPFCYKTNNGRYYYHEPLQHEEGTIALHTKNVWFFAKANSKEDTLKHIYQTCDTFYCGVFTLAGYDLRDYNQTSRYERKLFEIKDGGFDWNTFKEKQKKKFILFFETAYKEGYDAVVAVPLSCGAFKYAKYPEKTYHAVAEAFAEAVKEYEGVFDHIDMVAFGRLAPIFQSALDKVMHTSQVMQTPSQQKTEEESQKLPEKSPQEIYIKWHPSQLHYQPGLFEDKEGIQKTTARLIYFALHPDQVLKNQKLSTDKIKDAPFVTTSPLGLTISFKSEEDVRQFRSFIGNINSYVYKMDDQKNCLLIETQDLNTCFDLFYGNTSEKVMENYLRDVVKSDLPTLKAVQKLSEFEYLHNLNHPYYKEITPIQDSHRGKLARYFLNLLTGKGKDLPNLYDELKSIYPEDVVTNIQNDSEKNALLIHTVYQLFIEKNKLDFSNSDFKGHPIYTMVKNKLSSVDKFDANNKLSVLFEISSMLSNAQPSTGFWSSNVYRESESIKNLKKDIGNLKLILEKMGFQPNMGPALRYVQ